MGIFNKIFGKKKEEKNKPKESNTLSTTPIALNSEEYISYETVCNNGNEQNTITQIDKNDINRIWRRH